MARYDNPMAYSRYPTDPSFEMIGQNLGRALFGDPELAARAQLRRAQTGAYNAQAAYDTSRTTGQDLTNKGLSALAAIMANPDQLYGPEQPAVAPAMPQLPGIAVGGSPVAPAGSPAGPMTSETVSALVKSMIPDAVITDGKRDPNSSLGRANPNSYHNFDRGLDMRAVPGMTFDQMRQRLADAGVPLAEAIDEYKNPSPHSTGGHWHFGWKDAPASKTISIPGGGSSLAAAVSAPTLAAEPGGRTVNNNLVNQTLIAAALGNREGAITPLVRAFLAQGGGDANMRQALVAGGTAPGKDFAATREAQLNNDAIDQYGDLAKTVGQEVLQQAGLTQRENISQSGQDRRNAADNQTQISMNNADNSTQLQMNTDDNRQLDTNNIRDNKTRRDVATLKPSNGNKSYTVNAEASKQITDQIKKRYPGIGGQELAALAGRAADIYQQTGNLVTATQRAGDEMVESFTPAEDGWFFDTPAKIKLKAPPKPATPKSQSAAPARAQNAAPGAQASKVVATKTIRGQKYEKHSDGQWYPAAQ